MEGTLGWPKYPHPAQSVEKMEIEKRYAIKFFANGRMPEVKTISCLRNQFGEDILSRTQMHF
jgi:hypothetical protein